MTQEKPPGATLLTLTGVSLIVLGLFSIASPAVAGKAVVIVIGSIVTVAGVVQVIHGIRCEGLKHKIAPLVLGALAVVAGTSVLAHPFLGLEVLTLILAIVFIAEGIWKTITSFSYRPARGWLAMLVSGGFGFLLGLLIWIQWPFSGLWAVGILIGVDLLSTGAALVALALTVRSVSVQAN